MGGIWADTLASFASLASMWGAGFNHFLARRERKPRRRLHLLPRPQCPRHLRPRAYLEGRITEEQLENFRQEVDGKGLSATPTPS